jgi:hypothetical protein
MHAYNTIAYNTSEQINAQVVICHGLFYWGLGWEEGGRGARSSSDRGQSALWS